jgi:GDP-L-fucose synthase
MDKSSRIYVAGHTGLVGSAICRRLEADGYSHVFRRVHYPDPGHEPLDLLDQAAVDRFFLDVKPEYVFLAAAMVGGIAINSCHPVQFLRNNLLIEVNMLHAALCAGVKKLVFFGSSCIYPKFSAQPIREESLLTGALEETNEAYAIAKIAGIKLAQAYRKQYGFKAISLMPCNLYGPYDNFDLESSHVVPALIRKMHEAQQKLSDTVTVWGTGRPLREFLYVEDLADAAVFLMQHYDSPEIINVGSGAEISILDLARDVQTVVGYEGHIVFDASKPDGTPRKLLDSSKLRALGWEPKIALSDGLADTYTWFLRSFPDCRSTLTEAQ